MKQLSALKTLLLVFYGGLAPLGCLRQNHCNEVADEVRQILDTCDVEAPDYSDLSDEECTESRSAFADCVLTCYRQTSCQALLESGVGDCLAARCF